MTSDLCQFEDVFLPIDDLECSVVQPSSNVSRVSPAILVDQLCRLHRILEVALHRVWAFEADLRNVEHRQQKSQTAIQKMHDKKRLEEVIYLEKLTQLIYMEKF